MSPDRQADLLKDLLRLEADSRRRAGQTPGRDEYAARFQDFASIVDTLFPAENSTVSQQGPADPYATQQHVEEMSAEARPEHWADCGRFRILKTHARGGLGEVYVAQDGELHRNVALKRIRERFVDDDDSRARFLREAEITGNLEHPGIVPIYGLGKDEAGRPYYAMRFIEGESLRTTIDRFHDPQSKWKAATARQLELRKLLQRFIDVCNAMEYAHSRGVIHRDLKPENIMVGKYGETLVVDWGLAKPIGQADEYAAAEVSLLQVAGDGSSAPTQMGQAVGTPKYMSPEQAAGRNDELTSATDVYALGAVLYSILTGKPPVNGTTLGEVIQHVLQGNVEPLPAAAPGPLASICRKALALEPVDRYSSARTLAEDVEKWLADDRVVAHRESLSERSARWARAHRAVVTGSLVLTATTIVALVIGMLAISQKQQETERQRVVAETKQAEAETARAKEVAERIRADEQRDQAKWTAYRANIQAADAEWDRNQVASAFQHLSDCPPELRGWEYDYLSNKFRRGRTSLSGDKLGVTSSAVSRDGTRIATGGGASDPTVKVWDAAGQVLLTLSGHSGVVSSVAFSPEGRQLASASLDKTVKLWDTATGHELLTFRGHTQGVMGVAFSPNNRQIASACNEAVQLWNPDTGEVMRTLRSNGVLSVAFSNDGKKIVTGDRNKLVKVWDSSTGEIVQTLNGHLNTVQSVAFSPDGERIVSASDDHTVRIWDVATGREVQILHGHTLRAIDASYSSDGKLIMSASYDKTLMIWDAATGRHIKTLRGHTRPIVSAVFFPDGERIVSTGESIMLWEVAIDDEPLAFRGHSLPVKSAAFSPDGKRIVSASDDRSVRIWDANTGAELRTLSGHTSYLSSAVFSFDGKRILSAGGDRSMKLWDAKTGTELRTLRGHSSAVGCARFSSDDKRIVSAGLDNLIKVWNADTGEVLQTLSGHTLRINSVVFSPDGMRVASGSDDKTIRLWDAITGDELKSFTGHAAPVSSVAFSSDGRQIVSGSYDNTIRIWQVDSADVSETLHGHTHAVLSVAFSPDGKRLVSSSGDTSIKLWDTVTKQTTLSLNGHKSWVWGAAFSPDGKQIVSAGLDNSVKLWNAMPPSNTSTAGSQ